MSTQNGKGDKWRKQFNYSKYWDNFEAIEKKDVIITPKKAIKLKGGKVRYSF